MTSEQHYIFLSSNNGLSYHPNNSPLDFTIELSKPLQLVGKWECALIDFNCHTFSNNDLISFDLLCDICEFSIIGIDTQLILRRVHMLGNEISNFAFPYYMPVTQSYVQRIRIYMNHESKQKLSFINHPLLCTLHLRPCPGYHLCPI